MYATRFRGYLWGIGWRTAAGSLSCVVLTAAPPSAVVANDRHRPASHVFVSKLLCGNGVEGGSEEGYLGERECGGAVC